MESQRTQFPFLWQCISLVASRVRVRKFQYSQLFKDVDLCCSRDLFLFNYNALRNQRSWRRENRLRPSFDAGGAVVADAIGRNGFARPRIRRVCLFVSPAGSLSCILAAASYQKQAHAQVPALFALSADARLIRFAEK
jgi:hypothetical protein